MKSMQYAATVAFALALAAPSQVEIRSGPEHGVGISQYCVPPDHGADVQKLYCREVSCSSLNLCVLLCLGAYP